MNTRHDSGFNPWLAIDALQGVTDALHWQLTQGPASEDPMPEHARACVCGLAWIAQRLARELNEYFRAASEAGLQLPAVSVQEQAARYGRDLN